MVGRGAGAVPQSKLYRLRYNHAVNGIGQGVLQDSLKWLYRGGGRSFREYLFNVLCYSAAKYKTAFDAHQRKKLDEGASTDTFDVTLCYALIRRVCGLSEDDDVWTNRDPNNPTLENSVYTVKQHRNRLAHEAFVLTEKELKDVLQELEQLYCFIYAKSGALAGKDRPYITSLSRKIEEGLQELCQKIREPVNPSDLPLLQQEIKQCNELLKYEIEQLSIPELEKNYNQVCIIDIAPWLQIFKQQSKASDLFTTILLKEVRKLAEVDVDVHQLFQIRTEDNNLPGVLIFTGNGGHGKTTLLKYILEMWTVRNVYFLGLSTFKLVLYTEMRYSHISSLKQLLSNLLSQTLQSVGISTEHLQNLILEMPVLIILDGYDEKNPESFKLLFEILHLPGNNVKVIISTRPGSTDDLNSLVPHTKHAINFVLHGIDPIHHSDFVEKHIGRLVKDSKKCIMKDNLVRNLPLLRKEFGKLLNSPLTLSLFTLLSLECPETIDLSTSTKLFEEFRNFITGKLEHKLKQQGLTDVKYKCSEFLKCYDEMSFKSFLRQEYELQGDEVEELENKCRSLQLPPDVVLSSYYTVTRCSERLNNVTKLKPHHFRFQEHGAGRHVYQMVAQRTNYDSGIISQSLLQNDHQEQSTENELRLENVVLHVTGTMANLQNSLLKEYASQILEVVKIQLNIHGSLQVSPLLKHVAESRYNTSVITATATRLKQLTDSVERSEWLVEEHCLGALESVLKEFAPKTVNIVIQSDPQDVPHLTVALAVMSRLDIELEMYLMKHYWTKCSLGSSDYLLKASMANIRRSGLCCLKGWGGSLSSAVIHDLPKTLVFLSLRLDLPALKKLSELLPQQKLPVLQNLELHIDEDARTSPFQFPTLNFQGEVLRMYLCSGITDHLTYVTWAADVAMKLWPIGERNKPEDALGFRDVKLSSTGAALLIYTLAHRKLTGMSYLWIEFLEIIPAKELDQLRRLSKEILSSNLYV